MQALIEALTGEWSGHKALHLGNPNEPDHRCQSHLSAHPVAMGKFIELRYTWNYEQQNHEGLLLLGSTDSGEATAAWVDSWHQSGSVMSLKGQRTADKQFTLNGSFSVPGGPDWGWRIELDLGQQKDSELSIKMFNVSPEGEATLGVKMHYQQDPYN